MFLFLLFNSFSEIPEFIACVQRPSFLKTFLIFFLRCRVLVVSHLAAWGLSYGWALKPLDCTPLPPKSGLGLEWRVCPNPLDVAQFPWRVAQTSQRSWSWRNSLEMAQTPWDCTKMFNKLLRGHTSFYPRVISTINPTSLGVAHIPFLGKIHRVLSPSSPSSRRRESR